MSLLQQLAYLVFESNKREEWKTFAGEVIGLEVHEQPNGDLRLRIDENIYRFIVRPGPSEDLFAAGFTVANSAALKKLEAHLLSKGVAIHRATPQELADREVEELIWFSDPSGLRLEAVYNPKILRELPELPHIPGGFVTGNQGCGHIAIAAPDLKKSEEFYRDILEFPLSDYIIQDIQGVPVKFVFFHINPRHHTLALAGLPLPVKLHHFMLQVRDIDVVGHALDRVKAADIPLHMAIGKHPNDKMYSFYSTTPSEFNLELGVAGVEIHDEANWQVNTFDAISEWGHLF